MDSYAVPAPHRARASSNAGKHVAGQAASLRQLPARSHGSAAAAEGDLDGARRSRARRDHPRLRRHARARRRRGDPRAGRLAGASRARARRAGRGCATSPARRRRRRPSASASCPAARKRRKRSRTTSPIARSRRWRCRRSWRRSTTRRPMPTPRPSSSPTSSSTTTTRSARPSGTAPFAAAKAKEERGDVKGATDDYGWILAHDPNYARRGEMAHAFARYADSLRDQGDVPRALGYWRQAIDLAPDGPDARYAGARVALYDGARGAQPRPRRRRRLQARAGARSVARRGARAGCRAPSGMQARRRWTRGVMALLGTLAHRARAVALVAPDERR